MDEKKTHTVICQKWLESERGWGTRPDGYSLHLTEADREWFIGLYWEKMPDRAPDEYSRPDGKPYECSVSEEIFANVSAAKQGIRSFGTAPFPGGQDGWIPDHAPRLDEAIKEDIHKRVSGVHGLR
ncbi:MAG: hypothetical protein U1A25_03145 [Candidatus Sungbacteria bacterium]|nr:hypothetical protein [bacterium]MDZ4260639.1 hypothetical protein [Candidatus Sungbacteria bacterium]